MVLGDGQRLAWGQGERRVAAEAIRSDVDFQDTPNLHRPATPCSGEHIALARPEGVSALTSQRVPGTAGEPLMRLVASALEGISGEAAIRQGGRYDLRSRKLGGHHLRRFRMPLEQKRLHLQAQAARSTRVEDRVTRLQYGP